MNITPIALHIERFRSFLQPQVFKFPTEPGLYLMLGKNEVEPRLAGNGAGKSTVWDALTWLLYARTAGGLKAGDVCHWDEKKGTRVAFDFIADDDDRCVWTCERTWNPNTWKLSHLAEYITDEETIDLAKDPENPVLAALRLHFDAWLCTVVMAQGEDYFLDMEKMKQAGLFASVMNLEEWERRSERASEAATKEARRLRDVEDEAIRIDGKIEALQKNNNKALRDIWEDKRRAELDELVAAHRAECKQRSKLKDALEQAQASATKARDALASLKRNDALEDEYDLVCANVRKHEDKLLKLEVEAKALQSHIKELDKSDNCPTCGKPLDTHDWQEQAKRIERATHAIMAEAKNIKATLDIARSRRDVLEVEIDKQEDADHGYTAAIRFAEDDVTHARNELLACDKHLDALEERSERLTNEANPFDEAIKRAERELGELRAQFRHLMREVDDRQSQLNIKSMWVRGFKEIRLREIASALSELEMEVNNAVMALGLEDWELRFDVDRETKSGSIQKGFAVTVLSPNAKPMPWAAWSGGEKQRLRIAANAGLSDLVRARTGCAFPLEVWDEPTNGLSPEGKTDLFRYLVDRARVEGRIIFLLDHQAHDFGGFAGTCTIIKTPSGSRVRASW